VEALMRNVENIKDSKKQLEEFVNTKIVGKLTELDNSFTDIMKGIDIEPLVKELEPIQAELQAIESLIQTANLPDVPSAEPGPAPGSAPGAGPDSSVSGGSKHKSKSKKSKHNRTRKGGYIIPKRKQRSLRRKGNSTKRRT